MGCGGNPTRVPTTAHPYTPAPVRQAVGASALSAATAHRVWTAPVDSGSTRLS